MTTTEPIKLSTDDLKAFDRFIQDLAKKQHTPHLDQTIQIAKNVLETFKQKLDQPDQHEWLTCINQESLKAFFEENHQ